MKGQMTFPRLLTLVFALCISSFLLAQSADKKSIKLPDGIKEVTSVEGITEYMLESKRIEVPAVFRTSPSRPSP